jgi:hypothetical protein
MIKKFTFIAAALLVLSLTFTARAQLTSNLLGTVGQVRTNLGANSAANLTTGTLPDARLSANIATLTAVTNIHNALGGGTAYIANNAGRGTNTANVGQLDLVVASLADTNRITSSENIVSLNSIGNPGSVALLAPAFIGSGSGLTNLNASSLASGTVPDARLSANIATLTTATNIALVAATNVHNALGPTLATVTNTIYAVAGQQFSGNYSGSAPNVTPTAATAIAIDTSNGSLWTWYSSAWH